MAKTRTFIAVAAEDGAFAAAQQTIERLRHLGADVKWVEPENLHWTLQFLGDLTDGEIAEVCRRVGRTVAEHEPFSCAADHLGGFPSLAKPRTLWLGMGEGTEPFVALHAGLDEGLAELGFRGENRRFVPHLTLGRVGPLRGNVQPFLDKLAELEKLPASQQTVDEVIVFASRLARSGAEYTPLAHLPLGG